MATRRILGTVLLLALAAACRQDMHDTPRYEPLERSTFFGDERSARPILAGTVARGQLRDDPHLHTGKIDGRFVDTFPFGVDSRLLERGRDRYDIYCAPCHDRVGAGRGMVVRRGFRQPPSFHEQRLREAAVGYFFDVITNGFGVMPDYAAQIAVRDRWAIVAYLRALQLSQHATTAEVPAAELSALERKGS
ncbi:MAG: c-type cytochrome [Candidatus Binatia bacterium]